MTETATSAAAARGVEDVELTEAESHSLFDRRARTLLGVSGKSFLRSWHSGAYEGQDTRPEVAELIHLAPFGE